MTDRIGLSSDHFLSLVERFPAVGRPVKSVEAPVALVRVAAVKGSVGAEQRS